MDSQKKKKNSCNHLTFYFMFLGFSVTFTSSRVIPLSLIVLFLFLLTISYSGLFPFWVGGSVGGVFAVGGAL
jgi:hypothetical protein